MKKSNTTKHPSSLWVGVLIHRERLRRNWSQEGLCKGICSVSYLSKIESGKVEGSHEILHILMERLSLPWYDDAQTVNRVKQLVEACYEAVFSGDKTTQARLYETFSTQKDPILYGPYALDGELLCRLLSQDHRPVDEVFEPFFSRRQLALQRMLQDLPEEAVQLYPCAYLCLMAGISSYEHGEREGHVLDHLCQAYRMAADEGYVHIMLLAQLFLGNYYANQLDYETMAAHYKVARRLAEVVGDQELLRDIRYNEASTAVQLAEYETAYHYFSQLEAPTVMECHKLAIACEKLGKTQEGLDALALAQTLEGSTPQYDLLCELVQYRLEHPDYLEQSIYGELLCRVYQMCRADFPIGYAAFHVPWVLEWYTATRQYRAAYELLQEFPLKLPNL